MTFIVTSVQNSGVSLFADRLVTKAKATHDSRSNKSLIVFMRNAVVAMGYTGNAYVGQLPTDEWLVEQIVQRPIERGRAGRAVGSVMYSVRNKLNIELTPTLRRLQVAIDAAFRSAQGTKSQLSYLEILIAGFRWRQGHELNAWPILCDVTREVRGRTRIKWERLKKGSSGTCAPASFAPSANEVRDLLSALDRAVTPGDREAAFANLMRSVASRFPKYIGKDLLAIHICNPNTPKVFIRFLPSPETPQGVTTYSPWIIGPHGLHAPAELLGRLVVNESNWEVHLGQPGRIGGLVFGRIAQTRKRP